MSSFRIRPRFKHQIEGDQEKLEEKIQQAVSHEPHFISTHLPGHLYIKIDPQKQHFWSPQLHLSFEQKDDIVIVRGLYGPNPTLWAVFFFGYVSLAILSMFIGMWGLSRWSLGMSSTVLWTIPVFAIITLIMYLSAQAGQKLGAQQMFDIHHFYEEIAGNRIVVG